MAPITKARAVLRKAGLFMRWDGAKGLVAVPAIQCLSVSLRRISAVAAAIDDSRIRQLRDARMVKRNS